MLYIYGKKEMHGTIVLPYERFCDYYTEREERYHTDENEKTCCHIDFDTKTYTVFEVDEYGIFVEDSKIVFDNAQDAINYYEDVR